MDLDDSNRISRQDRTFWQRHALTILLVIMGLLFALVMVVQVMS